MNKQQLRKLYSNQLSSADLRLSLARQITVEAKQAIAEAKRGLQELNLKPKRYVKESLLTDEVRIDLISRLTPKKTSEND